MKKILTFVSEWGYWGEELVGPLEVLDAQGYQVEFMTARGRKPRALPPSKNAGYFDPPLRKVVVDEHYATQTRELERSERLDRPLNLQEWFPERPYFNDPEFGHELERYHSRRDECWQQLAAYDALLIPGGSGAMVDIANNQRLHDVILGFRHHDRLIAPICYAVTALAFARDFTERTSIIWGRHVTGHAIEYDYKDGTGFINVDANFGPPFYPLEFILRDAVGPAGQYHGGVGHATSTILDYPFLTGRSTQDSRLVGELMVQVLEHGLRRWGW